MSITTVRIIPLLVLIEGGTACLKADLRESKKTSHPSFLFFCFMYVANCEGPGNALPFRTFNSTTCNNPEEKVTRKSINPTPDTGSRIAAPLLDNFALAKSARSSWPCFSARFLNFPCLRDSQKELTASASTASLNPSKNIRMEIRGRCTRRLPDASTLLATV